MIAIFQKTGFMHIQAYREQYLFNNNIFLPILFPYQNLELHLELHLFLRRATKILKIGK